MPDTSEIPNLPSRDSVIADAKRKLGEGTDATALSSAMATQYPQYFKTASEALNAFYRKQPSSVNPNAA